MLPEHAIGRDNAIALAKTGWWKCLEPFEIVLFQLYERNLCMDFPDFHEAVEQMVRRPVFTHEFAAPEILRKEFEATNGYRF